MEAWNPDLNGLFGMFHDFTITEVQQQPDRITLKVVIPGELPPHEQDRTITVVLAGCSDLSCVYSTMKTDRDSFARPICERPSNDWITHDTAIISALGLEVQSHVHIPPDHYELRANSSATMHGGAVTLGLLRFRALAFKLYDEANTEIELKALQARW